MSINRRRLGVRTLPAPTRLYCEKLILLRPYLPCVFAGNPHPLERLYYGKLIFVLPSLRCLFFPRAD